MCLLFFLGAHQAVGKRLPRAHAGGRKAETCCSKALNVGTARAAALELPPSDGSRPQHWGGCR